jgi:hypothetical protein
MAEKIDSKPVFEEHIRSIERFLISMDLKPKVDEINFVKSATEYQIVKFGRPTIRNVRAKHIWLEGRNIDAVWYGIFQEDIGWWTQIRYLVHRPLGNEKKVWQTFRAGTKIQSKQNQVIDFKWQGGKLADVLNKDDLLKEPILSHLNTLQTKKNADKQLFYDSLEITTFQRCQYKANQQDRQLIQDLINSLAEEGTKVDAETARQIIMPIKEGVSILEPINIGYENAAVPLLLPSRDSLLAYERIAKHIKEYSIT